MAQPGDDLGRPAGARRPPGSPAEEAGQPGEGGLAGPDGRQEGLVGHGPRQRRHDPVEGEARGARGRPGGAVVAHRVIALPPPAAGLRRRYGKPTTMRAAPAVCQAPPMAVWHLAGRDDELARCVEVLDRGRGLLLVGPAGVGKSRLAAELGALRADAGHLVEHLTGSPAGADLPLAAVAPLLPSDLAAAGVPVLVLLRRAVQERAEGRPVTLVVDDAHLLDDASALLVHQLVVAGEVELVGTQRPGALAPDPVTRLWRDDHVDRVPLGPLDRAATVEMGRVIAGRDLDPAREDELWRLSRGNPLYVREVLLAALDRPSEDGSLLGSVVQGGAARLTDLVRLRLGDLDEAGRDAVVHIAFGQPLGPGELEPIVGPDVLVDLERRGLLASTVDDRRMSIRLVHPLYGEVLRAGVSALEARRVRYRLAEALAATGARRRADTVRLAAWSVDGGFEVAPALLARAAHTARFSDDLDLAERLARRAHEVAPTFATGQVLFDVLYEQGPPEPAEEHLVQWAALAEDDAEQVQVALGRVITAFWRRGDEAAALAALDEADARPPNRSTEAARALRATILAYAGRPQEALAIAPPLLEREPDRVLVQAALAATQALRSAGRPEEALTVVDAAIEAYRRIGDQFLLFGAGVLGAARISSLIDAGRLDEADAEVRAALDAARHVGNYRAEALFGLTLGWLEFHRGRFGAAADTFARSGRTMAAVNHEGMARWGWCRAALARATGGDADGAQAALAEAERFEGHAAQAYESTLHLARGWTAWLTGHPADARVHFRTGAEVCRDRGDGQGEMLCLHDLARIGDAAEVVDRVEELAPTTDGALLTAVAGHVRARATGDLDGLAAAAEAFAAVGTWLWASEAATAAGEAARRAGDQRAAAAWDRRAATWRGHCDSVRTPGLLSNPGPVPLTRREREVATLAAQGLASRDIGERLFIGTRTVESHLARIYGKLGIRSRAELSRLLDGGAEAIVE